MSFKTINLEEYKKLLKNKKKMFDTTFPTPEVLINIETIIKLIKKSYTMTKLINKIKIYQKCLIKT